MAWSIEFDRRAFKSLSKLSKSNQERVRDFLDNRILTSDNPRSLGSALAGGMSGLWRYRVGDIRIVAKLIDERLVIVIVDVGNRREIYR